MRDRREIEREIFAARQDLEDCIGDLKHVVREKLAVRARAGHAFDRATTEQPVIVVALIAGALACGAAVAYLHTAG
jgi:hypothetical protein